MSFRDDHEAALARADALEVALEQQRTRLETTAHERNRLAALVRRYAAGEIVEPEPEPLRPTANDLSIGKLSAMMMLLLGFVIVLANAGSR